MLAISPIIGAPMPDETKIVSIEAARAARKVEKEKKARQSGNCARGVREECGMKDPAECVVHGPYLPPDAS